MDLENKPRIHISLLFFLFLIIILPVFGFGVIIAAALDTRSLFIPLLCTIVWIVACVKLYKYNYKGSKATYLQPANIQERPIPKPVNYMPSVPTVEYFPNIPIPDHLEKIELNITVLIGYSDRNQAYSERRITIEKVYNDYEGDCTLSSFCHEKQEDRSFKLSRITKMVDVETGEIIEDFNSFISDRFNNSPLGKVNQVAIDLKSEISVLIFMARADGYLRKPERNIIVDFINNNVIEELDQDILENEVKFTFCTNRDFRSSIKKIAVQDEAAKIKVLEACKRIIATDKNSDPAELGFLQLIKKEFKIPIVQEY